MYIALKSRETVWLFPFSKAYLVLTLLTDLGIEKIPWTELPLSL